MFFKVPHPSAELEFFGQSPKNTEIPNKIKVLVWNVYKFKKPSFKKDFLENFTDCDLFFLQEMTSESSMNQFFSLLEGVSWAFGKSFKFRHNHIETGVALGSKLEVQDYTLVRGSEKELLFWTPKVSLIADLKLRNTLLVNTHVVNFTTTSRFKLFMEDLVDRITHHHGPIIFAGDFNTWSLTRWHQLLELLEKYNITHHHFENG